MGQSRRYYDAAMLTSSRPPPPYWTSESSMGPPLPQPRRLKTFLTASS